MAHNTVCQEKFLRSRTSRRAERRETRRGGSRCQVTDADNSVRSVWIFARLRSVAVVNSRRRPRRPENRLLRRTAGNDAEMFEAFEYAVRHWVSREESAFVDGRADKFRQGILHQ